MALTKIDTAMIAEGAIDSAKIANTVALGGPKITGLDYPGDDTAAIPAGGQTIIVAGSGFASGCAVFFDGVAVGVVSFISSTQLQFIAPAKATGLYTMYVVNPDGGTAILVPGMVYSGTPTWTTASGSIGTPYETTAVSINLAATGDGALSYAVTSGSSLPTGLSLSSGGAITGTVPATAADTTYTFNVDVIDSENQSTTRQFSLTYRTDVITWSSPAAGASFTWAPNEANTTSLSAISAAGGSVSYSVQSGSLPTGVSVSGSNIAGTPTAVQANTSVVIRATATTSRFADRTLYFTVSQSPTFYVTGDTSPLVDSSSSARTITLSSVTRSTSTVYSGSGSVSFSAGGTLEIANTANSAWSLNNYPNNSGIASCFEAWCYFTSPGPILRKGGSYFTLGAFNVTDATYYFGIGINNVGGSNGNSFFGSIARTSIMNQWKKIAIVRRASSAAGYQVYVNGVQVAGDTSGYNVPSQDGNNLVIGGGFDSFNSGFGGFMDEIKIFIGNTGGY